jgi:hypothetical protein
MQKLVEQIQRMKTVMSLNENFVQPDLTPEYFMSRVPFLKTFHNNSNENAVGFQKVVYNSNVDANIGGGIHNFPNFNTVAEFYYSKYKRSETTFDFTFSLKFEIIVTKPDHMHQFVYTAINMASRIAANSLSYNKEFINKTHITKEELDQVINDINGKFFAFEEYITERMQVDLKNPLNESIEPSEAYNNYDSVMSIIKGKRNIGQITYAKPNDEESLNKGLTNNQLVKIINEAGLEAIKIKSNEHNNWIIYKPGYEKEVKELNAIAEKYGGYFPTKEGKPEDVIRIGQLLGYNQSAIDTFIQKNFQIQSKINEQIEQLNEFIGNDMVYLKQYLSMTDQQKQDNLPYEFPHFFDEFLQDEDIDFQVPTNQFIDSDGITQPGDPMDSYEIPEWLSQHNKELFKQYGSWLKYKVDSHSLDVGDPEYPAWSFFGSPSLVKNQWLIHFTSDADGIAAHGFKYGVDDMTKLGLTTNLSDFEKKFGGYNFAYLLSDFKRHASQGYTRGGGWKYGNEAVIFRASGIRTEHYGDEEPQVIFYGNTARDIIPVESGENKNYAFKSKLTGRILYEADDLQELVYWLVRHFDQYRKHLL